jgi:quinolinate synthase
MSTLTPSFGDTVSKSESSLDARSSLDLEAGIRQMRHDKNAVILAHYYQEPEIQDLADFVGDSLDLSRKAAATDADIIVFCGVRFMAEVAKILSPQKKVLLPDMRAGCSLETSCPPAAFKAFREAHPDHLALTYINCSAEVKALSDIIVTSSNAEAIIRQIPETQNIIFAPDKHLGQFLIEKTGRDMLLWQGACMVHERFSEEGLVRLKTRHPAAAVIAHPECPTAILRHADHVGSTSSLIAFTRNTPYSTYIVATELGILHQMRLASPDKTFLDVPGLDSTCACNACPYMRLNTVEKLYQCMKTEQPEIILPEDLRLAALRPLQKMLAMSPPPIKTI